jgi:hypothetical protein
MGKRDYREIVGDMSSSLKDRSKNFGAEEQEVMSGVNQDMQQWAKNKDIRANMAEMYPGLSQSTRDSMRALSRDPVRTDAKGNLIVPENDKPEFYDSNLLTKKKGGVVKKMSTGGSASSRGDGCAVRGKTKGRVV